MRGRDVLKRDAGEGGKGVYANTGNDRYGLRREGILEGGDMGLRIGAEVSVCDSKVGEEEVFVITDRTSLTGRKKEVKEDGRRKRSQKMETSEE